MKNCARMYEISSDKLKIVLHHPGDGFYRGTRFDRSGVFGSMLYTASDTDHAPVELCGRWFSRYDPFMHDAVCGPAEEFSLMVLPGTAPSHPGTAPVWLKPGVGLLVPDGAPYDRFKLYEIADEGVWRVESTPDSVTFIHELPGYYVYEKQIVRGGKDCFEIRHKLHTFVPLEGDVYNHNFFTFGKMASGPSREIELHCTPDGDWRAQYSQVGFVGEGLRFTRILEDGESVYCGNIHEKGTNALPYCFTLRETSVPTPPTTPTSPSAPAASVAPAIAVHITGDRPASKAVFWANHRIACLEPYTPLHALPGTTLTWTLRYTIALSRNG